MLRSLLALPAIASCGVGLLWLVAPSMIAPALGMRLLDGAALSTQIADLASFFLTLGVCIGIGVVTDRRVWLYPPMLMLSLATTGRVLAWAVYGAALTWDAIAIEVVTTALLIVAARVRKVQP